MLRRFTVLVAFVALAGAAAPGAARMPVIAPGVNVLGVRLGGLTSEPARLRLERAFARPIAVEWGTRRWASSPARLGAAAVTDVAVTAALTARPGASVPLRVQWSKGDVRRFAARVAQSFDRTPVDARLVGVTSGGPVIRPAKPGIAVSRPALLLALEARLRSGARTPVGLPTRVVPARLTKAGFGPVIWIDRRANLLRLYDGTKLVRRFRVATGRAQYPTPAGLFTIVVMQVNPSWRPPATDWARGLKPVAPGPGNPLGTRWMGLSAEGVGIHGTPDAASIGYSVSHGCIRMQIPDAEWLFSQVHIGTPVYIT